MSDVTFRELASLAELKQAEDVQRRVWGDGDMPDNADLMLAIQHEGGLVAGAFRDGQMLGFLFAFPSATPGIQHSHRLAVLAQARGLRLGVRLKWYQRDWCLARAIRHVRWTFDPLRAVNAGLNVASLGGVADRYLNDYYGAMEGINAGLPSDRIMLDWHLESEGVAARAAGRATAPDMPAPDTPARIVPIPRDIDALMRDDPAAALRARMELRAALTESFAQGLRITGFDTGAAAYHLR
ncbi:MAG: GNAT family N-acetyltransferase [Paracoccus sp. (in: a-proteobacteria)]